MSRSSEQHASSQRGNHRWAFPVGLLLVLLASVGVVAIVMTCVDKAKDTREEIKARQYQEYVDFLSPVIMNDPDPFDDITGANNNQILDIIIWSVLKSDNAPDEYDSETGGLVLPQSVVNEQATVLFGPDIILVHETVDGYGYQFRYDIASESYIIPITGVESIYTPRIEKVEKKGNSTILTVGYLAGNDWAQDVDGNIIPPEPAKYMKISLRENNDSFYVLSIRDTDAPEVAKETKP